MKPPEGFHGEDASVPTGHTDRVALPFDLLPYSC